MDIKDLYLSRAEDFTKNFFSFRQLEWRVTFQLYAGYAAIVLSYSTLHNKYPYHIFLAWVATVGTLLLAVCFQFLILQLQRRLHYTRMMQNTYFTKLHEILDAPELTQEEIRIPKFQWWYAFWVQTILNFATSVTLIVYYFATTYGTR